MNSFKYCMCCLVMDVKLHSFDSKVFGEEIREMYSRMLQIQDTHEDDHMCFECSALLYKYTMFKDKCSRAHQLLSDHIYNGTQISRKIVENIDREKNKLETNVAYSGVIIYLNTVSDIIEDNVKIEMEEKIKEESELESQPPSKCDDYDGFKDADVKEETFIVCDQLNRTNSNELTTIYENLELKKDDLKSKVEKIELGFPENDVFQYIDDFVEPVDVVVGLNYSEQNDDIKDEPDINDQELIHDFGKHQDFSSNCLFESEDESLDERQIGQSSKAVVTSQLNYVKSFVNIIFLNRDEALRDFQQRKKTKNYINSQFRCEYCYKGYGFKGTFENHIQKHKEAAGPHKCDICHLRYLTKSALTNHIRSTHKMKFICKHCPYVTNCLGNIKVHVDFHQGERYECRKCGEVFSMPNTLYSHLRRKHDTEMVCEFCGETFVAESGLLLHKTRQHRQEKNEKKGPECDECDIHFANETAWRRHLVLSSKHGIDNGCRDCGAIFSDTNELRLHKNEAHADKKWKRTKKDSSPKTSLLGHIDEYEYYITNSRRELDTKPIRSKTVFRRMVKPTGSVICEVCGKNFKSATLLRYHQRQHTGERPFKCADCEKSFHTSTNLHIHRQIHENLPALECDMCDKTFKRKTALIKHIRNSHLHIRPHKCPQCEQTFPFACEVKYHVRHAHCNVPWPKRKFPKKKPNAGNKRP